MRPEPYEAVTESLGREVEALKSRADQLTARIEQVTAAIREMAEADHRANGHYAPRQSCTQGICEDARNLSRETP